MYQPPESASARVVRLALLGLMLTASCVAAPGVEPESPDEPLPPPIDPERATSTHLALGTPVDDSPQDDYLIARDEMVVGYNRHLNAANWVSWRTTSADFGTVPRYAGNFITDTSLPAGWYHPTHADFTNSGFDRGHLVRSEERTATAAANKVTFVLSNVLAQTPSLNRGPWYGLERMVESKVRTTTAPKDAYMIAGPVWAIECTTHAARLSGDGCPDLGRASSPAERIAVPEATFKIIVFVDAGASVRSVDREVISVVMPNVPALAGTSWDDYVTTVADLERLTGYDFLSTLE